MTVLCSLSEGDVDEITEVQATPTISADHHTKRFSDFTNIIHVETHLVLELVLELDWGDIAEVSEIKLGAQTNFALGLLWPTLDVYSRTEPMATVPGPAKAGYEVRTGPKRGDYPAVTVW